jgi:anti-anti-sigma factor
VILRQEGPLPGEVIQAVVSQMPSDLMLDLAGATYVDSSGLEWLLEIRAAVVGAGGTVTAANASPLCAEIIRLTRLDEALGLRVEPPHRAHAGVVQ